MFWTIVTWIILGAIAGWVASLITGMDARVNNWMNVVVGILGAIIGGFVLELLGTPTTTGFNVPTLLTAILGAVILLGLVRAFRHQPM